MINVQVLLYGVLFFISVFLSACGGSSDSDGSDTQSPINIESYLSGKSLRTGQNNYTYLMPDKRFYSYANGGDLGWIYHGAGNTGTWLVDNNMLRMRYEDSDVWVYRIEKDKNQATLIENGESVDIGTVSSVVVTPQGLIQQLQQDHTSGGNVTIISASELIAGQWIVLNLTDGHSITVNYSDDKKLYRHVGHTIKDKGFVEQDTWRISSDGRKIIHRDVTHELIKKETGCYFTRSTSASDSNWVKEYKLCAGSGDTGGSGDTTAPVITLQGEKDVSVVKGSAYVDAGASATDDVDGDVAVTVTGEVETDIAAVYTLTYTAQDKAGNSSSVNRIVRVIEQLPFKVSPVEGNTVEYNSVATFTVQPVSEPTSEVIIPLASSDEAQGVVEVDKLVFTPENWESPQTVTLRGTNRNPVDDKQDYQVVLSPAESVDLQYQGVDIEDIAIRGISLAVSAPDNLRAVLAGVDNEIALQAQYNGGKTLYYELESPVDNMTIEPFSGVITYRPDESLEGSSVDVAVSMTDGRQTTRGEFKVRVAETVPVETRIEDGNLVIVEGGNELPIVSANELATYLSIKKIDVNDLPPMPENVIQLTDFYYSKSIDENSLSSFDLVAKKLNPSTSFDINLLDLSTIGLYSTNNTNSGKWDFNFQKINSFSEEEKPVVFRIKGGEVYFLGAKKKEKEKEKPEPTKTYKAKEKNGCSFVHSKHYLEIRDKGDVFGVGAIQCDSEDFTLNIIDYDNLNHPLNPNIFQLSLNYGQLKVPVDSIYQIFLTSIEKIKKKNIGLNYPKEVNMIFSENEPGTNKHWRNRGTAITNVDISNDFPKIHIPKFFYDEKYMSVVISHEFFHTAQVYDAYNRWISAKFDRHGVMGDSFYSWLVEGTAEWFNDIAYDSYNSYIQNYSSAMPFKEILSSPRGLLKKNNSHKSAGVFPSHDKSDHYKTFPIWKLIESSCDEFSIKTIFDTTKYQKIENDYKKKSSIEDFKKFLKKMECDFSGFNRIYPNDSLENLLFYYQYLTIKRRSMHLLDSNEPLGDLLRGYFFEYGSEFKYNFNFMGIPESRVLLLENNDFLDLTSIPFTGAKSFKVKNSKCSELTKGIDSQCRKSGTLKFEGFKQPLAISVTTEDDKAFSYCSEKKCNLSVKKNLIIIHDMPVYHTSFILQPDTNGNYFYDFTYQSDEGLPELFVTIVNPTIYDSDVGTVTVANKTTAGATSTTTTKPLAEKGKVTFIAAEGKIEATVNFNETTIDPDEKLYVNLVRTDVITSDDIDNLLDQLENGDLTNSSISDAEAVAAVEADTTQSSPFVHTFEGLELTRYTSLTYGIKPDGTETVYDIQQATITEESPDYTEKVTHEVDMGYVAQTDKFTQAEVQGTWNITETSTGKAFTVAFNSDETVAVTGSERDIAFSDGGKWVINDKDELEVRDYFFEPVTGTTVLLTTHIHKISGNEGGCPIISSRMLHSGWTNEYKMCKR